MAARNPLKVHQQAYGRPACLLIDRSSSQERGTAHAADRLSHARRAVAAPCDAPRSRSIPVSVGIDQYLHATLGGQPGVHLGISRRSGYG